MKKVNGKYDILESYTFEKGDTTFTLTVTQFQHNKFKYQKSEFCVFIDQITKVSDIEGCEDMEDFKCTFKCVCLDSSTPHSALHFAGKKYIKDWNRWHRIGTDYPLKKAS